MKRWFWTALLLAAVVGAAYWATLGSCRMMGLGCKTVSWFDDLNLSPEQRKKTASLEKDFLVRKQASCQILCEKRAQMIQLMKQQNPDRVLMDRLVEEIGTEQTALEKATISHLLALQRVLNPVQRERFFAQVSDQLRNACKATACGMTSGCSVMGAKSK